MFTNFSADTPSADPAYYTPRHVAYYSTIISKLSSLSLSIDFKHQLGFALSGLPRIGSISRSFYSSNFYHSTASRDSHFVMKQL